MTYPYAQWPPQRLQQAASQQLYPMNVGEWVGPIKMNIAKTKLMVLDNTIINVDNVLIEML